ncbi:MAG TPA: dipeptide epimerase [Gemmatales bacterium]|nr:dipeptide epimerase [Gemmatales bacterium]HMP58764.1 dipeptide epimerase [Gemmatales bacterium]
MAIKSLTALAIRVPLRRTIRHASHARTETDNLLVRCELTDGTVGWGEGVPRSYVTGETIDSALAALRGCDWSAWSVWPGPDWAAAVQRLDDFQLPTPPDDDRRIRANSARCAMELALLDAAGRQLGQPLSSVTGLIAPGLLLPQERVQYSGAITSSQGVKAYFAALGMRLYGFAHLKIKVGIAGQDDVARLRLIRRASGARLVLRLDANEAWQPDNVAARIAALLPFEIASVEQPVPHAQIGCLPAVRRQLGVRIMHDESLCGQVDAERAVADGTCDLFNLRLSKCGGFLPTLHLAAFAREHGLGCQLGCQVGETGILSAAGRHFATSVAGLLWREGSYDRRLLAANVLVRDITFGAGGWAPALTEPGLGVTIDEQAVDHLTQHREPLWPPAA